MSYEKTINDFHDRLFAYNGHNGASLGWRSKESQRARFDTVLSLGDLDGRAVLDVGCGFGDLSDVLREKAPGARYTGYDINPHFIELCQASRPDAAFECRNILTHPPTEPFDVIVSVGPINIDLGNNEELMRRMIKAMFKSCHQHCVMSMSSDEHRGQDRGFHYYNPMKMLDYCLSLTKSVALRHDYLQNDFSVFLFH